MSKLICVSADRSSFRHYKDAPPVRAGARRLYVAMLDESGSVVHAAAVLSKGQVTSMLAALLAIYPRLEEA